MRDTTVSPDFSGAGSRGITVTNPSAMSVGWNVFTFSLKDNIFVDLGENVRIKANIQLVADVGNAAFIGNVFNHNSFFWSVAWLAKWVAVRDAGFVLSVGGEVFKYFAMSNAWQETDPEKTGDAVFLSSGMVGVGLCWPNNDTFAKPCNVSDFLSVVNSSSSPPENVVLEDFEEGVVEVSFETLVASVHSETGYNLTPGISPNVNPDSNDGTAYSVVDVSDSENNADGTN
ncbi:MAG: hypothetical protein KC736_01335, partial [Candidatus Moranbacteria bacterium]|nr:hypothetical protein [Candidatus Moranbacteria bacterium]